MSLKGRDFLSLKDFTAKEIHTFVDLGLRLKKERQAGTPHPILAGQSLGMIFQKASTRTRLSFEVGIYELGGQGLFLNPNDMQIGRGEPLKDTARVLSRYLDGILIRTFSHAEVEELAYWAEVPVINGLTDTYHPTQVIADLITITEHTGPLKDQHLVYLGDGNNMAHSLMIGCAKLGLGITVCTPERYAPDPDILSMAEGFAKESGGTVRWTDRPKDALEGADIVYTDTWSSMGQESEKEARAKAFADYTIDGEAMALAKKKAIFMHCLPAYRGYEVTDEVIECPQSVVFDEAENRLHAHKAIMAAIMNKGE